ncbi:ABC transporter ATP-binding protein [Tabrizicola sp.]|uniref:ABC transporter ATP-binding protein n=1 Tax=Tabrizicola sp. TaxID=2005166 RepID=UPI00286D1F38|nr:ABC transporter ATP-binding protein [Tabrizicola sp.]
MSDLVTLSGLSKRFVTPGGWLSKPRSMMAVRGVDLSIPKGGVVGVVGESGCGKSTLARLVLRLIDPTSGSIRFDGTELTTLGTKELRRIRRRMSMVFQDPYSSLDPRYTVSDVLTEPSAVQGAGLPEGRIGALLDQVGLSRAMAQSYPHQMSGGQRQRVGIARALAMSPDLVVLDEPTASLDVSIQAQIIALLQGLQRDLGLTYLFISHDLGLVRYFCDQIVVMYLGSVVERLPHPAAAARHPYTAALMASNFTPDPMQRRELASLTGEIPSAFALPKGCAFAARCPRADAICRAEVPELKTDSGGHAAACFHPI